MRARVSRVAGWATLLTAILLAPTVQAQTSRCGSPDRPRVDVTGEGAAVDDVMKLLRAELAPRAIDVCPAAEGPGPASIATVSVSARPDGAFVEVEVHDALTAKRVSRDVDLGAVPQDGRPLTLALVADELLRASWAEIALRRAPDPAQPVPTAVRESVREDVAGAAGAGTTARWEVVAEGEAWAGSLGLYGVDVRAAVAAAWGSRRRPLASASARAPRRRRTTARSTPRRSSAVWVCPCAQCHGAAASGSTASPASTSCASRSTRRPVQGAGGSSRSDTTVLVGAGVDGWVALGGRRSRCWPRSS